VVNPVTSLRRGCYRYDPFDASIAWVRDVDEEMATVMQDHLSLATGGEVSRPPPAFILITAVFGRTMWKYRDIGLSLIYKEVCLLQTFYLVATSLGLGGCAIGGGPELKMAQWLGLNPNVESPVAWFVLGCSRKRSQPP
jgi:SagB-type dehydrogenase family enzyme